MRSSRVVTRKRKDFSAKLKARSLVNLRNSSKTMGSQKKKDFSAKSKAKSLENQKIIMRSEKKIPGFLVK